MKLEEAKEEIIKLSTRERILAIIESSDEDVFTVAELLESLERPKATVLTCLKRLRASGKIASIALLHRKSYWGTPKAISKLKKLLGRC